MPSTLGIVTGLRMEAELLRRVARGGDQPRPLIEIAGLGEGKAQAAAQRLIARGATHLMSFGIAGGLDPKVAAGTIIVASEVRGPKTMPCDKGWAGRLANLLAATSAPLMHVSGVLTASAAKVALFASTGAIAADMESYGVAEVAAAKALPFAALRVVADTADDEIPPVAMIAMAPEGHVRPVLAVLGALTNPGQIPALIKLGRCTSVAMKALEASARLGAGRGFVHVRDE